MVCRTVSTLPDRTSSEKASGSRAESVSGGTTASRCRTEVVRRLRRPRPSAGRLVASQLVRPQYLHLFQVGNAGVVAEKPLCHLVGNAIRRLPIAGDHLDLHVAELVHHG